MKILIATGVYPPDIGGPATYSKLLVDKLPGRGVDATAFSFGNVRRVPKIFRHFIYTLRLLWHGRAADIIFAQDTFSVGLPAMIVSFILGKTFLLRIPGDYAWEQSNRFGVHDSMQEFQNKRYGFRIESMRRVQRLVANQADKVIVPSRSFTQIVRSWVKNPEKIIAIYNGVDLAHISKIAGQGSFDPKTIISAGRLVPGKGFDMLIGAMEKLPGWKLEIAGDGPEMPRLQALIETKQLSDRVLLSGRVDRGVLLRKIAKAELFVLNTAYETFSFQIVEALAVGTPVIATRVGSLPELVQDGQSGILVDFGVEAQLVDAVKRVSADPALRTRLSQAGKERSTLFSIETTVDSVSTILESLEKSPSRTRLIRAKAAKLGRYLLSGGTAAATDLILLFVLTDIFGFWYILSSAIAFIIAFIVSFVLQKFFTFQDHDMDGVHGQALLYFIVAAMNLVVNTLLIYTLVHYVGLHYLLSQVLTSIVIAIESFIIYRMFIFAPSSNQNP